MSRSRSQTRVCARLRSRATAIATAAAASLAALGLAGLPASAQATGLSQSTCHLGNGYSHVVYLQFDNLHLFRDNPNVPGDLQQIPNLYNFLTGSGVTGPGGSALLNNDHTILISHTAGGIVSSLTGLYPDRNGITVSNSQVQYVPGTGQSTKNPSAFSYWTDPVSTTDSAFNLTTTGGANTPAPWVPYTRAGCDVGAFSIADMELENTSTASSGDITTVFGPNSPQAAFATWSNNAFSTKTDPDSDGDKTADANLAVTDFEGIAVHCAAADSGASGLCSSADGGEPDQLPSEPGSYTGYSGLFGAAAVNQVVSQPGSFVPSTVDDGVTGNIGVGPIGLTGYAGPAFADVAPPVDDVYNYTAPGCQYCAGATGLIGTTGLTGPITTSPIADSTGDNGFPGFSPTAAQALGYVASMQESGIPITMAYIADAHDDALHCNGGNAMGPGQACFVAQLRQYNQAFGAFFERLAADGINRSNTLFVVTVDEGDHYAGGPPTNPGCDGVNVPCTYTPGTSGPNTVGEIDVALAQALRQEFNDTTPFNFHFDDAPTVQVDAPAGSTAIPGQYDPQVRQLERDMGNLTLVNPRTGNTDQMTQHIADKADESILHMVNSDPLRTPTFTDFGDPDYFFQGGSCPGSATAGCPTVGPGFAWNHGDDNSEISHTWIGYAGPTIQNMGESNAVWTDHTDVRPTMLEILGLADDYQSDGDATAQVVNPAFLPIQIQSHLNAYEDLVGAVKAIDAPFGQFGHDSEIVSTTAVESTSPGDAVDQGFDQQLASCNTLRNQLVAQIQPILQNAEFNGGTINDSQTQTYVTEANDLVSNMHSLSQMVVPPDYTVCGTNPAQGPPGDTGATGQPGATGSTGPAGTPGTPGTNGSNGATGPAGTDGATGPKGATGPTGPGGPGGANGQNGAQGSQGPQGPRGAKGATPKVKCHASISGTKITVKCSQSGKARDVKARRATVGLTRGHTTVAYGSGSMRKVTLHTAHAVHGRYLLSVLIQGFAPLRQFIRL